MAFGIVKAFDSTVEMEDIRCLEAGDRLAGASGPPYLSPTSLGMFWTDREEFYMNYIARVGRGPTTLPMLVGSAFDSYVKAFLGTQLFGAVRAEELGLELGALLLSQVGDPVDRADAYAEGRAAFKLYVSCGALADLMLRIEELSDSEQGAIRFEGDITDTISGVRFRGKPDMSWESGHDGSVTVLDWKVNGWCASGGTSPAKGYRIVRPSGKVHKLWTAAGAAAGRGCFSLVKSDWAKQLCIYGWLLGCPVGSEFRVMIDQIAGRDRVAHHEGVIGVEFQASVMKQAKECSAFLSRGVWPVAWRKKANVLLATQATLGPLFR